MKLHGIRLWNELGCWVFHLMLHGVDKLLWDFDNKLLHKNKKPLRKNSS